MLDPPSLSGESSSRNSPLAAAYTQDGVEIHEPSSNTLVPLTIGAAIEVPEPSSILSLSATTAGLVLGPRRHDR